MTDDHRAQAVFLHDAVRQFLEVHDTGGDTAGLIRYMRKAYLGMDTTAGTSPADTRREGTMEELKKLHQDLTAAMPAGAYVQVRTSMGGYPGAEKTEFQAYVDMGQAGGINVMMQPTADAALADAVAQLAKMKEDTAVLQAMEEKLQTTPMPVIPEGLGGDVVLDGEGKPLPPEGQDQAPVVQPTAEELAAADEAGQLRGDGVIEH